MHILTLAFFLIPSGVSPVQTSQPLTVEEAVGLAIKQNPKLSAAAREIRAAHFGVRSAAMLTNPNLVFTPGLTGVGGSDEELLLQQPLEVNGTRSARTGVARAQLREAQARAVIELRDLVFDTKVAYYELVRAQELRSVARETLRIAEELDRGVRRQVQEGLRPGVDQIQTGVEVSRTRRQLTLSESQVTISFAMLNTLMGRPPSEAVGPLPVLTFEAITIDRESTVQQALTARREIAAEEALREGFLQEARLARAQGRPDLVPQFRADSVIRGVHGTGIGLGISLPVFDYGGRRLRVRQAEASASAQEARIVAARRRVQQEVEQTLTRLQAYEQVIRGYQQEALEQARQLLQASLRGFQLGAPGSSVLTVLEAQRTYRLVLTEYTNALVDHAKARAELERARGAVPEDLLPVVQPETRKQQ